MRLKRNKMEVAKQKELIELAHKYKMEEIKFEKECKEFIENLKHSKELERGRIKTAEIRKAQERKENYEFAKRIS